MALKRAQLEEQMRRLKADDESSDIEIEKTSKNTQKQPEVKVEKGKIEARDEESDDGEDIKPIQAQKKPPAQLVAGLPREPEVHETEQDEYIDIKIARPEDLNLTNMRNFITTPPPRGFMVQCTIMRDKTKLSKKFSPKYHVYLSVEPANQGTEIYIMTGKKRGIKASSSYYIGYEKNNFEKEAGHLVCKLR